MKYISISFLPGSAGNFFSRCLNLLSNAYCFGRSMPLPTTLEKKLEMLNYNSVLGRSMDSVDWVKFENQLIPHGRLIEHYTLPSNSYSIWFGHLLKDAAQLAGPDDQFFNFHIDPTDNFEWVCMNALYKNSYLKVEWFINNKKLLSDPTVYKINLGNFLKDWKIFFLEFKKVTDVIGHTLSDSEVQAVKTLHDQWKTTILEHKDIETFKKNIGFLCN
jgi:hypothetical protein